eukprot:6203873-Pleurochrysis_carterae.AAC.5
MASGESPRPSDRLNSAPMCQDITRLGDPRMRLEPELPSVLGLTRRALSIDTGLWDCRNPITTSTLGLGVAAAASARQPAGVSNCLLRAAARASSWGLGTSLHFARLPASLHAFCPGLYITCSSVSALIS